MTEFNPDFASAPLTRREIRLAPAQQRCFDRAATVMRGSCVTIVQGETGVGKTSILRALHDAFGGIEIDAGTLMARTAVADMLKWEHIFLEMMLDAMRSADTVFLDLDVNTLQKYQSLAWYHRRTLISLVFKEIYDVAARDGKKIVISASTNDGVSPHELIVARPIWVAIEEYGPEDYRHILSSRFGEKVVSHLDIGRLFQYAQHLSAYQLNAISDRLLGEGNSVPGTDDLLNSVEKFILRSNIDTAEVEQIGFEQLIGAEGLIEKLDRTILLPINQPELAAELGLEAKHGVLLYGAPGTGKTTVGRALAHQMKGKFFQIDGNFDHESGDAFFSRVDAVFASAQRNSPSVIFIDDADVVLSDPRMQHFSRYLLTKLDGLQSKSLGRVCVMMTAMNIADMPLALLRSGRLEVWLETKLPNANDRARIIQAYVDAMPGERPAIVADNLAEETEGFTPADLRRLVGDAVGHLAFDAHSGHASRPLETYLEIAAKELRAQKALADAAAGKRKPR